MSDYEMEEDTPCSNQDGWHQLGGPTVQISRTLGALPMPSTPWERSCFDDHQDDVKMEKEDFEKLKEICNYSPDKLGDFAFDLMNSAILLEQQELQELDRLKELMEEEKPPKLEPP